MKMNEHKDQTIWNRTFIILFTANMLSHSCIYMMNTLSSIYADYLGATATVTGLVSGLFALTALIFKLVSAPAIDTFNRKYVLTGAFLILFLSFVGYSMSQNIPMLIISRLLTGTGMAFSTTCCITMASDALPKSRMQTGIGYFSLGTALCQAIAPSMGLFLSERLGYIITFLILAGIMLLAIVIICNLKIEHTKTKKFEISVQSMLAKEAAAPAAVLFFLCISYAVLNSFLVLYAGTSGIGSSIGGFFTIYAVTMLFTRPFIGKMADKYGTLKILIPSMICFAAAFWLISFSTTIWMFYVAAFISAFGFGGCQPSLIAVCMKSVPKERRGAASSTGYAATDLSNLIGPLLAGWLIECVGYIAMWKIAIVPMVIAVIIAFMFKDKFGNLEKRGG